MMTFPGKKKEKSGHLSRKHASDQAIISAWLLQAQPFGAGEPTFRQSDLKVSGQLQNSVLPKQGANKPLVQRHFQSSAWRAPAARSQKHQQVTLYKPLQVSDSTFLSHSSFKELLTGNCALS